MGMISKVFIIGTVKEVDKFSFIIEYEHLEYDRGDWNKVAYQTEVIGTLETSLTGKKIAAEATLKGDKILMFEFHNLEKEHAPAGFNRGGLSI
jgi:hypothetical protein